ncbi:YeiH family protein [Alteromonas sp. C1M14]|uniref:YeiH family protein n=1 Tax=Alteromonas sp. C1M14 TaxID=2841567 RepID=UPI001C09EF97|nr:YeiH family protein [Alteromonas sp. C1M14]MBU2976702.1 YeiH family protein [Alteromonas sp. C1M14]
MEKPIRVNRFVNHPMLPGIASVFLLAALSVLLGQIEAVQTVGVSPLTIGIVLGIAVINVVGRKYDPVLDSGVDFAKSRLLKLGVILFGLHFTYGEVLSLGWRGLAIDLCIIVSVLCLSLVVGRVILKLDYQTSLLVGTGSAICGAAAILATAPVIKAKSETVVIAVSTVVIFGTASMFLYPMIWPYIDVSATDFGVFIGSTIHEVAQVVAAGTAIGPESAQQAVLEKMLRVILLAPFLVVLALCPNKHTTNHDHGTNNGISLRHMPWFALYFLLVIGANSLMVIPEQIERGLMALDTLCLTMAMVALGLKTHVSVVTQAGYKPLLLGAVLFVFLIVGGGAINSILLNL